MTPRLPRVTGIDVIYALRQVGFEIDYVKGSHYHLRHKIDPQRRAIIPIHRGKIIKPKTLKSILNMAQISVDDLIKYL